ncbi:Zinc-regulated transporter [Paramyrothecium foliicola]|nr:Zinc-regulated transporter [Paramyrothecium foliicola]
MDPGGPKPQCGGGNTAAGEEYNVGLHVGGLFLVLAASLFGAGFPVVAKKIKWLNIPTGVFFACKHFGTGVLVATAFVHLLPTTFASLTNPCLPDLFTDQYPAMPGVIMMGSMFALFVIEMYLNAKTGGHSHGGPTGSNFNKAPPAPVRPRRPYTESFDFDLEDDVALEKRIIQKMYDQSSQTANPFADATDSQMPPWFVVFYEQYVRQRMDMMNVIRSIQTPLSVPAPEYDVEAALVASSSPYIDEKGNAVDPHVYRKMSTNITMLEGGILFHSIFVGMTISITTDGFIILLIAILFHQMFEGLGLGSRIAAVPYPKGSVRPWLLVFAFGTTAPIGQAIGLLTRNSYDPDSALGLILVGVFNGISSGLLIYAALVDLLAEDFLSDEAMTLLSKNDRIKAFSWVLAGAAGMSIVGAFA